MRKLAWILIPPVLVLLLRAALKSMAEDDAWEPLRPAAEVSSAWQALWVASRPFVFTLLGLLALVLGLRMAVRRFGLTRLAPWLQAAWVLLWVALAVGLSLQHANVQGRQALPAQTATLLLVGEVPPSARSVGGVQLYLSLPGEPRAQRLFVPAQAASAFAVGSQLPLQLQAGRWWGRWAQLDPSHDPRGPAARTDNRAP